jgi:uncharacterized membrane protein
MSALKGKIEAITSSLCFATAPIFAKKGFSSGIDPFYGIAVAGSAAFLCNLGIILAFGKLRGIFFISGKGLIFTLLASLASSIGIIAYYLAINLEKVSIIVPISCTYPLFTMIFTQTLLRKIEPLDLWTVLGTLFIVLGVIMVL